MADSHEDDWRLNGQQAYLKGCALRWRAYRARTPSWEHEHCEFCWAKFMDPGFSDAHRQYIQAHPDVFTAGYTTADGDEGCPADCWVCQECFHDFAQLFEWRVVP